MTKIVKIRKEELGDENPFLGVIFIVDLEYDLKNWFISWKYHKNDLKCQNGISCISSEARGYEEKNGPPIA